MADARWSVSPVVRPAPWQSSKTERFSILKIISFYRSSGLWLGLQWKWATGSRQQHQSAESTTSHRFTRGGRDQCGEKVCWKHVSTSQRAPKVCGYAHTLAVTDEGALYAWGANSYGQVDNTVWQYRDFDKTETFSETEFHGTRTNTITFSPRLNFPKPKSRLKEWLVLRPNWDQDFKHLLQSLGWYTTKVTLSHLDDMIGCFSQFWPQL